MSKTTDVATTDTSLVPTDTTHIVMVVDRSGSMGEVEDDAREGINSFIEEQVNQPGDAVLTMIQFNTKAEVTISETPIEDVKPLTREDYRPEGFTALFDAVGGAIDTLNAENPDKAAIVIQTDGKENRSKEYTLDQIRTKIEEVQSKGWLVIFLGADDSEFQSRGMGIDQNMSMSFDKQTQTRQAYAASSSTVSAYRAGTDPNYLSMDPPSKS